MIDSTRKQPPERCVTDACFAFLTDMNSHLRFLAFTLDLAKFIDDYHVPIMNHVVDLLEIEERESGEVGRFGVAQQREQLRNLPNALAKFRSFDQIWLGSMYTRTVDYFLIYLTELLAQVFRARPETLRSDETVTFRDILEHQTMDDLIKTLIERRVTNLSFKGMASLEKDLQKKLAFSLFPKSEDFQRAVQMIEVRNLLVHNRGVVNKIFLSRVTDNPLGIGEQIKLDPVSVTQEHDFLVDAALDIDQRAASKWGLPTPKEVKA